MDWIYWDPNDWARSLRVRTGGNVTADEENAIVNDSTEAMMKLLTDGGKPVEAIVTVVLFKGGEDYHIGTMLGRDKPPTDEAESGSDHGNVLLAASDLIDTYVHENNLCADCNSKKGPVQ